ncbi:phosphatidate cytidylyltransferase [Neoactinobaculum massilliense]|uniref:phosphatidate cytidylyltransferase n=1 Tax=Neoactinobaculum massilliense TaxID=2364794 RepID=UPI001F155945|nr:phosphatidate cytidylyltransferase [Neoactinobaculum massilliense]
MTVQPGGQGAAPTTHAAAPEAGARGLRAQILPHPPAPPAPSASRAGRDLTKAVPTAIVLLAVVAGSVLADTRIFLGIALCAIGVGVWEAAGAFLNRGVRIPWVTCVVGAAGTALVGWLAGLELAFLTLIAVGIAISAVCTVRRDGTLPVLAGFFAVAWIGFLGAFALQLALFPAPLAYVALLVLMPVANDIGGWGLGILIGKHKMAPAISPGKSWEGFAGSVLLTLAVGAVLAHVWLGWSWAATVVFSVAATLTATVGDLSESLLKRDLGVKDMGSIFPGHGGMLDRLDSILMWAPICYLLAIYLPLVL